uniref:Uncharacterized protein n=1 Tax=viral metagenome TaxID=1070528 RepID=A0A6M3J5N4_9ZZZZ
MSSDEKKFERVRPDVLNATTLLEVAGRLGDLFDLTKSMIPSGVVDSFDILVTGSKPQQVRKESSWFNVSIYNDADSTDSVFVSVNKVGADKHEIKPDDTYNVNMGAAKIYSLFFRSSRNGSATVSVTGVR